MTRNDESQRRLPREKSRADDTEFGRLLRGAIRAISGFERLDIVEVEEIFCDALNMTLKAFPGFYKRKAVKAVNEQAIAQILHVVVSRFDRAYLDRTWAKDLIKAAYRDHGVRFYDEDPDELINHYWPPASESQTIISNLPATTYPAFVPRVAPLEAVLEGLRRRYAVVMIIGMGGIGKTSLARAVAERCLQRAESRLTIDDGVPTFDAVVWVSDKGRPGTTTVETILNEIAATLDCPEHTRLDPTHKRLAIKRLLRSRRVLLVVDNGETIADTGLFAWLAEIPDPSKALITTRAYRHITEYVWRVDLGQMSPTEGRQFIELRSQALHLPGVPEATTQDALIAATGGNPRAMELFLGLAKRTGRSIADLTQTFAGMVQASADPAVSDISTQVFDALFAASWASLSADERQIMLALALLPDSVADPVLVDVAGSEPTQFHPAIRQLADLSLVETEQQNWAAVRTHHPRRGLHPLTRQFVGVHLATDPAFAAAAGERWLQWAVEYAATYGGHRPNDLAALRRIDAEEPILWAALEWAVQQNRPTEVVHLARTLEFFYYVQARWNRKQAIHEYYIAAATHLNDLSEQVAALTMHIIMLSRQGQWHDAQPYLEQLQHLEQTQPLQGSLFFNACHARALYQRARGDLDAAAQAWQDVLDQATGRGISVRLVAGTLHWLGLCRSWQQQYDTARTLLEASLDAASEQDNPRRVARNEIALALIELEAGQVAAARRWLAERHRLAEDTDEEQRAHLLYVQGRLHAAEGEPKAAQRQLNEALHLFERMGLVAESEAAREALEVVNTLER